MYECEDIMKLVRPVVKIDPNDGFVVGIFDSSVRASEDSGGSPGNIRISCNGTSLVKGFYYRYLENVLITDIFGNQFMKGSLYGPIQLATVGVKVWCLDTEVEVLQVIDLIKVNPYTGLFENEIWHHIDDHDGDYYISNFGRIKRKYFNSWKLLKPYCNNKGYQNIDILTTTLKVHRLVGKYFVNGYNEINNIINHINEIKDDNNYWNLEWCTQTHNVNHGTAIERRSYRVNQLCKDTGEVVNTFKSSYDAFNATGIDNTSISKCCNNVRHFNTAGGFKWEFADK